MSEYPALQNFLSAYFHQDWAMEHDTPGAVAEYYRDSEKPERVAGTREALAQLLAAGSDEDALGARVRALVAEYDPTANGGTWRGWAEDVAARLEACPPPHRHRHPRVRGGP